ncbi:proline transporter 2-like [Silene latifolia]|uniref:proline transporter 2-like n=1 Tax=Silene latifolia TaxID=37657 RepID=UPI003D789C7E
MESSGKSKTPETFHIENGAIKDEHFTEVPASAHSVGHDSWQQVGLMMATGFNCGWILSFSNLMLVPLGWAWGIPCLFLIGLFTWYANWLLAGFHFIDGQRFIRYKDMIGHVFGKKMYYITWISQSAILILGNMGFILLGGRGLKEINLMFSDSAIRLQYFIIITGVAYFIFSFVVPNMSAIRVWLGALTILTFGYIGVLLVIVINDGKSNSQRDYEVKGSIMDKVLNAFSAISVIIVCNTSGMLPEIQSTLRKPEVKNMRRVLAVQYTAGLVVYYGVSILGYWAYGSEVSDYLPKALSGPKWAKVLINLAVFLQNVISQHVFVQPVHEALDTKFLKLDEGIYSKENIKRRFFLRLFFFIGCTVVTAAIPFMGDFITLLGSFTLIMLTFIFPSVIFIKVKGKTARVEQKAWHWTIICVSSLLAVVTSVSAVRLIVLNIKNYQLFANQ